METYDIYLIKLITKLYEIRGIARQNLIAAKKNQKNNTTEKSIHKI